MDQLYANISNRIDEWNTQLGEWATSYQKLVNLDSFQGTSAESAKTYLQEVHGILLYSLQQAMVAYQANFLLYKDGYYNIEPNIYSNIPQQAVQNIANKMQTENQELDTIADNIQAALSSVSDIYPLANPTFYHLYSTMNGVQNTLRLRDQKIDSYEDSQYTYAYDNVQKLLDSLQRTIEDYLENGTNIASYSTGDMAYNINVQDLYQKVEVSSANIESKQIEIEEAANQQMEVYAQMQADYEAACEARKDEGTAKMIMGGFAVALGIIAIVGTAGMATPVVVVAGISGTCTMAYGMSNMTEGAQDYYYGSIGDLSTEAINPIRDTYFCGNQELYDAWGNLNMTIAGLCIPVGNVTTGVTGFGNVAKVGLKTVGKEMLKDRVYDELSGVATNYLADKFDLNMTQSTILNVGLNIGMDKTGDAIGGKISGLKNTTDNVTFAKDMDTADAAHYEAHWNALESGKANLYPGLSEADIAAWDLANGKLNEHIVIKDVDTDAVIKLRADEMAKQDAFLKVEKVTAEGGLNTSIKNIDEFIGGNKSFDDVLDDYAKVYADKINSNQAWSWDDIIPGGENLTKKQRSIIKQQAIDDGLIPDIKVTKVDGMRYGFADFETAGVVKETQYLPKNMWKMSDAEQFKWLDEQIGGTVEGYTWHHTEIPGKMQLVPTGIHNITTHNGGRTAGMWADAPR